MKKYRRRQRGDFINIFKQCFVYIICVFIILLLIILLIFQNNEIRLKQDTISTLNSSIISREDNINDLRKEIQLLNTYITQLQKSWDNLEYNGEFTLTFYTDTEPDQEKWIGQTSTGVKPVVGRTIAVDPSVIPYGTVLYIEGFGIRIAEDCGGAIKGNKIDILVDSSEEANKLGVKKGVKVWIIK